MDDLHAHLKDLEERLFQPSVRGSRPALEALLSADFREIGRSGKLYGFDEVVEALLAEQPDDLSRDINNFETRILGSGITLVTYQSELNLPDGTVVRSLRSSIWRLEDDNRWRMVFHQGTSMR